MNIQSPASDRSFAMVDDGDSRPRGRRWMIVAIAMIVVAAALALFFMRGSGGARTGAGSGAAASGSDAGAVGKGAAQRVTVVVPGRTASSAVISATGTLGARRDMPVGVAGEGGRVTAVLVEPGQWVRAGQTLAVIDRSVQSQQAAQLQASIAVAQADAALAQSNLDRARSLVGRGFVSKADLDSRTATRDSANARVAVARAQLSESRALIGRLDVRSPAAGLVLARSVEAGQIVSGGTGALFRIAKDGELEMLARLAEQDLAALSAGRPAQVTPVGSARSFTGRIWQVSPIIDPATRQGIVRIALPYDPALRPGGFATASITSGAVDAPLLPQSAVLSDAKGNFVYVVDAQKKVVRRPITVGQVADNGVSIQTGLNGTEQVIVSAGAFVNPGDTVIPARQAAPAATAAR